MGSASWATSECGRKNSQKTERMSCLCSDLRPDARVMQVRKDDFVDGRPTCPQCRSVEAKMHRHGVSPRRGGGLERFYCPPCGTTVSVLDEQMLPYRKTTIGQVQEKLDAELLLTTSARAQRPCGLVADLARNEPRLRLLFGQMVGCAAGVANLWRDLRRLGPLREILRLLEVQFKASLFYAT